MKPEDAQPGEHNIPASAPFRIVINSTHRETERVAGKLNRILKDYFGEQNVIFPPTARVSEVQRFYLEISQQPGPIAWVLLIGPEWIRDYPEGQRRWNRPYFMIDEMRQAGLTFVPILINDGELPPDDIFPQSLNALIRIRAEPLRERDFHHDVEILIDRLATVAASSSTARLPRFLARQLLFGYLVEAFPFAKSTRPEGRDTRSSPSPGLPASSVDPPKDPSRHHSEAPARPATPPADANPPAAPPANANPPAESPPPGDADPPRKAATPPRDASVPSLGRPAAESSPRQAISGELPSPDDVRRRGTPAPQSRRLKPGGGRGEGRRSRTPAIRQAGDEVSRVVRRVVRPGLLIFNPPSTMIQGHRERVEVGIARSPELRDALEFGLRGRGHPQFEDISTSPYMGVELMGSAFEVTSFSPLEQLVAPVARWEFDVTPYRAGRHSISLCISLRIDSPNITGGRMAVPVLEREIQIQVDIVFGTRRFLAKNWQWLIATILGLGGALTAWITFLH